MPKKDVDPFSCFQLSDGRWRAVAQTKDAAGKARPKTIERKTEADVRRAMRDFLRNSGRLNPAPGMSVAAMLETYLDRCAAKGLAEKTIREYGRYRRLWSDAIGHVAIDKLTPAQVEAAMEEFSGTKDAINARAFLRAAINRVARKAIPSLPNVAALAEPPRHTPDQGEKLTEKRLDAILAKEQDPIKKAMWLLFAGTGIRPTEGRTLRWSELEEREDGLWIRKADAKTAEGKKPIPLPPAVSDALRGLPIDGPYVFPSPVRSGPYGQTAIRRFWARAVERADLPPITLYELRHLFGTVTARKVKDHILARLMRHTDARTSKKYYVDEEDAELRRAIE